MHVDDVCNVHITRVFQCEMNGDHGIFEHVMVLGGVYKIGL